MCGMEMKCELVVIVSIVFIQNDHGIKMCFCKEDGGFNVNLGLAM